MPTSGLEVFDSSLQKTHIWLDEIMGELGVGRRPAWHVLGVVLRAVRDRLPLPLGAKFSAQLPLLVRGAYYDQFRPADVPVPVRSWGDFLALLAPGTIDLDPPIPPARAAEAVFGILSRHLDPDEIAKVQQALPHELREHWAAAVAAAEALP
ncbi:MAG: DUF2267 domain-containing protein [Sphingomonadaceae bacterium]|nr:DUF2267 domain-containing protein [Sphingomonadaceae bacterium]